MTTVTSHSHFQPVVGSSARAKRLRHNCSRPCEIKSQLPTQQRQTQAQRRQAIAQAPAEIALDVPVQAEADVEGMSAWLDSLKWDAGGLVTVITQVMARQQH